MKTSRVSQVKCIMKNLLFLVSYKKEEATDLVSTLKNVHYSLVSKLSDAYIRNFDDKAELLNTVLALGLSEDVGLIQNLCVILNKILTSETVKMLDERENRNLMELTVLVMAHWISHMVDADRFVLNNTLLILEMLVKSCKPKRINTIGSFCSSFKNRPCVEKLLQMSKDPMLNSSTKAQLLRIASSLTSSVSLDSVRYYHLARFDNGKGEDPDAHLLTSVHNRELKMNHPFDDCRY